MFPIIYIDDFVITLGVKNMTMEYKALQSVPMKSAASFVRPKQTFPDQVKLSDPAMDVMTDLTKVSVVSVRAKTSIDRANAKMIRYGVRMLLVLDESEEVAGLLTATDVLGEKPMHFLQNMGGTHADIMVRDIMTTQRDLQVVKLADVKNSKVGAIVATLKKSDRQHALVVEEAMDGRHIVCGLFSITQIARLLGASVQSFELARTFAEIEAVIACDNLTCPVSK